MLLVQAAPPRHAKTSCFHRRDSFCSEAGHSPPSRQFATTQMAPKAEKKVQEKQPVVREYTIDIHKRIHGMSFKERAPRALREIRAFAAKAMGTRDVRMDTKVNKYIWSNGIRNVPRRIRVRIQRKRSEDEDSDEKFYSVVSHVPAETFEGLVTKKFRCSLRFEQLCREVGVFKQGRHKTKKNELELRTVLGQMRALEERLDRALPDARRITSLSKDCDELRLQVQDEQSRVQEALRSVSTPPPQIDLTPCVTPATHAHARISAGPGSQPLPEERALEDAQASAERLEARGKQLTQDAEAIRAENNRLKLLRPPSSLNCASFGSPLPKSLHRDATGMLRAVQQTRATIEALQQQCQEREEALGALQADIQTLERTRASARQRAQETEKAHLEASQRRRESEGAFQEKLDRMQKELVLVEALCAAAAGGPGGDGEEVRRETAELQRIEGMLQEAAAQAKAQTEELEKKRETLIEQNSIERNIADNVAYRKKLIEVRAHEDQVKQLEARRAAIPQWASCIERLEAAGREVATFRERHAALTGRFKLLRKQLLDKQAAIDPTVDEEHRQALIRLRQNAADNNTTVRSLLLHPHPTPSAISGRPTTHHHHPLTAISGSAGGQTTEIARRDLVKFQSALEKALMRFHSTKMSEVNHLIREIWQQTYQGHDIDYIEIKSDMEKEPKTAPTAKSRARSYTYRVVMVKDKVELDMRGRCSAGQKELASLVIRLALAETFCLRCGILALDEPTANLDRANVESFATTIIRLITALKRHQDHFQLIVITHDEEFVQHLAQGKFCQYYWRVSKDDRTGSSKLERNDMISLG
ncbi:putative DNA repair protein RAD50 [Paratrimastix pyriformis]|uniref:DNA repair protein RAD50 n=1 Tax=Paratrimastix pyriformis TaxID=342808 RepID=A0ABQ8UTX3_9EUKA|nr:putative DNA repair protein RAD50 [Paratrimastix pyriformis]